MVGGQGEGLYRLWATNTAPPSAQSQALIVSSSQVVRGQFAGLSPAVMNGTAIGLGAGDSVLAATALPNRKTPRMMWTTQRRCESASEPCQWSVTRQAIPHTEKRPSGSRIPDT